MTEAIEFHFGAGILLPASISEIIVSCSSRYAEISASSSSSFIISVPGDDEGDDACVPEPLLWFDELPVVLLREANKLKKITNNINITIVRIPYKW